MKKFLLLFLVFQLEAYEGSFSAKAANVYSLDEDTREIFGPSMPLFQIEFAYGVCPPLRVFGNAGYQFAYRDHVRFHLVPFECGVKYSFCDTSCFNPYIAAGLTYSYLCLSDPCHHASRTNLGGVIKTGFFYRFLPCGFVELFVDYYYTQMNLPHAEMIIGKNGLNVSSLNFGGALGFTF